MDTRIGSVYILSNNSIPNRIKIGRTQGLASQHVHTMTLRTGLSTPFEVAYEVRCEKADELEWSLHDALEANRCPGETYYAYPIDYEYPVEAAIWELDRLHFPYLSIDAATLWLQRLHFNFQETSEPLEENNHPWNQKAKALLLQLPDDDDVREHVNHPYNQVETDRLYVLQLMEWGMFTCGGHEPSQLRLEDLGGFDNSQWTNSQRMIKWRAQQWREGQYAFANMSDIEQQMFSFNEYMTPKQIMLFLMAYPWEHPQEAINPEMYEFMEAEDPATAAMCLFITVSEHIKEATANWGSWGWTQQWWTNWW